MHLRTLADTAAILAWHGLPPRPCSADQVDAGLRLFVVNSRLLMDSWAPLLFRSRITEPLLTRGLIAEEVLSCELLARSVVGHLHSAGVRLQRQQQLAQHLLKTHRDYSDRAVQQVSLGAGNLSDALRIERLKRRLQQWGQRLMQPGCISQHGLDALWTSSTNDLSRARPFRHWTTMALSLAVPNHTCNDGLRSGLMQEICSAALSLIPASAYQQQGSLKTLSQRVIEQQSDSFVPVDEYATKRW